MARLIELGGSDIFTHLLVVGPTRSGKTATILKPMIYQLLLAKKRGVKLGLSVIEPKGDVSQMVADIASEMELPHIHIDPMQPDITANFNPMEGEINDVAEATVVVLKGLFGKQDAFFATVQELSARSITRLLKELNGDNMDITDVLNTLRDDKVLKQRVAELKARDGMSDLVHFFESELLGSMADKYRQFVIGLRAQLENVISNDALRSIMTGKSSIDIDKHFSEGGILAVNTALGKLRSSGDAFGQFIIMHLQNGTFRRPGTEDTRVPHYLIIDEYSRYINPDVEIFLSLAAEYRVAGIFATQSLGQLAIESGKLSGQEMKRTIMASCRSKIAFGGLTNEDAKDFAEEFGKDKIIVRQSTYKNRIILPNLYPDSFRDTEDEEYRFDPTDIRDALSRFTYIHQLMQGGVLQKPEIAEGTFIPRSWKELREWESKTPMNLKGKFNALFGISSKNKKSKVETVTGLEGLSEEEIMEIEQEAIEEEKAFKLNENLFQKEVDRYTPDPVPEEADIEEAELLNEEVEDVTEVVEQVEVTKVIKQIEVEDEQPVVAEKNKEKPKIIKAKPKPNKKIIEKDDGFW